MVVDEMGYHIQFLLLISFCLMLSCHGLQFKVGNQRGWAVNPSEKYNDWAGRLRFQVNDTLLFKYSKGVDSVLVVNKNDYDNCNTDKPILKFDDGNTIFKFDRSGPFYFITGNKDNCQKGQKMIVVVLSIRNRSPPAQPSPTPSPTPSPPGQQSPSPSPTPSPPGQQSPSPSPASQVPVPSPSGGGLTPASAPAPTMPPSSVSTPSPSITPAGSPGLSPPGGVLGPGPSSDSTPSDVRSPTSPPGGSSATPAFTASAVLFSTVSLVLYGALVIFN